MNELKDPTMTRREVLGATGTLALFAGGGMQALRSLAYGAEAIEQDYKPVDGYFGQAYIDVDEWRDLPERYRHVHGGFKHTATKFSFYFPAKERYRGRFLQSIEGGQGGNENTVPNLSPDNIASFPTTNLHLAFSEGAYLVESNQGHIGADFSGANFDPSIVCWRASAEAARFSKFLAAKMYGAPPHHGYVFGGSGGGIRSLNCLEQTKDVWDGGVPFIMPHYSQGTFFSLEVNAQRILGKANMATINDAIDVGGSGNPFEGLNPEQADILATLYKSGFPRGVALDQGTGAIAGMVWTWESWLFEKYDPTYFDDFWSKPGYMGHDNPDVFKLDRVSVKTKVARVLTAHELVEYRPSVTVVDRFGSGEGVRARVARGNPDTPVAIVLDDTGQMGNMGNSPVKLLTGAGVGRSLAVLAVIGDAIVVSGTGGKLFDDVKAGDEVLIDNRDFLAYCYHYRHQVAPRYVEWSHSVVDGKAIYPQRPFLEKLWSHPYRYDTHGKKIIIVNGLADRGTWPCGAVAYRENLKENVGDAFDSQFRLWFQEHQDHGGGIGLESTHIIELGGYVQQAMHDLILWVERGTPPQPSSKFTYTPDHEVILDANIAERKGIQPIATVTANGKAVRLEVKAGTPIEFEVNSELPPGTGAIVKVEWDFDGKATWPIAHKEVDGKANKIQLRTRHTFSQPGTYFPSCRVTAHREGDTTAKLCLRPNLARVRVVVT